MSSTNWTDGDMMLFNFSTRNQNLIDGGNILHRWQCSNEVFQQSTIFDNYEQLNVRALTSSARLDGGLNHVSGVTTAWQPQTKSSKSNLRWLNRSPAKYAGVTMHGLYRYLANRVQLTHWRNGLLFCTVSYIVMTNCYWLAIQHDHN